MTKILRFSFFTAIAISISLFHRLELSEEAVTFKRLANGEQISEIKISPNRAVAGNDNFNETIREWGNEESGELESGRETTPEAGVEEAIESVEGESSRESESVRENLPEVESAEESHEGQWEGQREFESAMENTPEGSNEEDIREWSNESTNENEVIWEHAD